MKRRLLIIDAHNAFIRNFVVVPSMDVNGEPIGGLIGFLRSMKNAMKDVKPTKVIVVWDGPGGSLKRRSVYKDYKAGRKPRANRTYDNETLDESAQNFSSQISRTKRFLGMLGVSQVEVANIEADDVIAFMCKHMFCDVEKVVVSSDKDFIQLVDSKTIVYSPTKKVYMTLKEVRETVNVLPENYIYVKALMGDASDNVKGIGGIGMKTAIRLFPFLSERPATMNEVLEFAQANVAKSPKYKSLLDARDIFSYNVQLMQLSCPIIGSQSVAEIMHSLDPEQTRFALSELKLALVKDSIQLADIELFSVLKEYKMRSEQA